MAKSKSKASNKLQNVKAVKEMLAGTHKSQTRKSFGFTGKSHVHRNIGDTWTEKDVHGNEYLWEQKDGFRVKKAANSIIDEVNKIIKMPSKCPNCGNNMYGPEERLNKKFWATHKTCFDCVITMETKLRAEGKYEDYERKKLHDNATAFFNTADQEVNILKNALKEKLQFVQNAQGEVEEYDQSDYNEQYLTYIDKQYNRFKNEILTELKTNKNEEK
tara:strand:- start:928 stop:1578 length:651 start_codon:yes stop_codon:yes gene_type:complete